MNMGFIIAMVILIFSSIMLGFCLGVEFYREEITKGIRGK